MGTILLQAIHSGADLQSAAAAVLGYSQVSMKGKAVAVEPVPGIPAEQLQKLLAQCMAYQQLQVGSVVWRIPALWPLLWSHGVSWTVSEKQSGQEVCRSGMAAGQLQYHTYGGCAVCTFMCSVLMKLTHTSRLCLCRLSCMPAGLPAASHVATADL